MSVPVTASGAEVWVRAFRRAAWPLAVLLAAVFTATACAEPASPDQGATGTSPTTDAGEFIPPPSSDVLDRALRTDLCALLDEQAVARRGWQRGTAQGETLTMCAAASPDQRESVRLSLDTAVSGQPAPAQGNRCTRASVVDPATAIAVKVQVRAEPDPCAVADHFLATATQRFAAGAGQVTPLNPWTALDACRLLPPLLAVSARTLGGPKPTLREVRRLGARGCIATHAEGEVTLSVSPASGRAEDLDGDEVAVAGRPARVQDSGGVCLLRLVGQQLAGQVQVATVEVQAADDRCAVATAMAEALLPALPPS